MAELGWPGIIWLTFSLLAAIGASCGFFLPYWLHGTYQPPRHAHLQQQQQQHHRFPIQDEQHHDKQQQQQQQQQQPPYHLQQQDQPGQFADDQPHDVDGHRQQQPEPQPPSYVRLQQQQQGKDQQHQDGQQQQEGKDQQRQNDQQQQRQLQQQQQQQHQQPQQQQQQQQQDLPQDPVFLGTFRRCNYPRWNEGAGRVDLIRECGRYTRFSDIPSLWWQISSITCGTGAGLALLVATAGVAALCVRHVMTKSTAKMAAVLQLTAALLIGGGVAVYPLGWSSPEVRQVCGPDASPYQLGTCELYWAFYLTASAGGLTLLCSLLALCAPSGKADHS